MDLVMAPRSPKASRQDEPCRVALERLLSRSGLELLVCDSALHVEFSSHGAERALTAGELDYVLARAVRESLEAHVGEASLTLENGWTVHVAEIERVPGPRVLIWLYGGRHESQLGSAVRERYGLGVRGQQLVKLLREGLNNREIAARLGLSEATVKTYLHDVYRVLGVRSRTAAIAVIDRLDSINFR